MADQKRITLRSGHASPKTIILYELPVADAAAGTTIVLYEGHATAKTVVLRNPADIPVAGGTVEIALAATEAPDVFAGAAGLSAEITLAVSEAPDDFAGTVSAIADLALAATEEPDTFAATVEAEEAVVEVPGGGGVAISSGGGGGKRRKKPVPPRELTYHVFSRDDGPRPISPEEPPRVAAHTEAPAAEGKAFLPSAAASEIAAAAVGPVEVPRVPEMPAAIAANDDEEAMMIILALAA